MDFLGELAKLMADLLAEAEHIHSFTPWQEVLLKPKLAQPIKEQSINQSLKYKHKEGNHSLCQ